MHAHTKFIIIITIPVTQAKGFGYVCPRPPPNLKNTTPVLDLESSYVKRHINDMPKQVWTCIWCI